MIEQKPSLEKVMKFMSSIKGFNANTKRIDEARSKFPSLTDEDLTQAWVACKDGRKDKTWLSEVDEKEDDQEQDGAEWIALW